MLKCSFDYVSERKKSCTAICENLFFSKLGTMSMVPASGCLLHLVHHKHAIDLISCTATNHFVDINIARETCLGVFTAMNILQRIMKLE